MLKTRQSNRQVIEMPTERNYEKSSTKHLTGGTALSDNVPVAKKKQQDKLSVRPTPQDRKLLEELRLKTGLADSSVFRLALRSLAKDLGLKVA